MEMQQICYFLALCEAQNFTQAAKRCGVSQPSLTNGIRRLERELGGNLFYRGGRKTKLSPLGVARGGNLSCGQYGLTLYDDGRIHTHDRGQ